MMTSQANSPAAGIGLLAVTASLKQLYSNRGAERICGELNKEDGQKNLRALPRAVKRAVTALAEEAEPSVDFVVGEPGHPILLQAFVIPSQTPAEEPLIIIVLEKRQPSHQPHSIGEDLPLTGREKQVLNWLQKGHTNKEIGAQLEISEQTVKKHVSCIMLKSRMSNRTGVLARLFGALA
jgi:DNA-binding CsgD family transcriptional regulator